MNVLLAGVAWLVGWVGGGGERELEREKEERVGRGGVGWTSFSQWDYLLRDLGKVVRETCGGWGWVGTDCRIDGKEGNGWKKWRVGGGGVRIEISGD